jgi:hypothetical protein
VRRLSGVRLLGEPLGHARRDNGGETGPFTRAITTCASCRRQTTTLVWGLRPGEDKCAHCSRLIGPDDPVEVVEIDRFHRHCWIRLTSVESVRSAKILSRRSEELIRKSRELMGLAPLEGTSGDF